MARTLLSPERLRFLRGPDGKGRTLTTSECSELADAYDLAIELLTAARDVTLRDWRERNGDR